MSCCTDQGQDEADVDALSGNRFRCLMADIEATGTAEAFTNVEELSLSSTYMSWEEVCLVDVAIPRN